MAGREALTASGQNASASAAVVLFSVNYTDADVGRNAQLRFELDQTARSTLRDAFRLRVTEHNATATHRAYYTLQIDLPLTVDAVSSKVASANGNGKAARRHELLVAGSRPLARGAYRIAIRIADLGYPSCVKTDTFRVLVGSDELDTEARLVKRLREGGYNEELFVNDEFEDESEDVGQEVCHLTYQQKIFLFCLIFQPELLRK